MAGSAGIPDLEERFLEPENWRWHHFEREGRKIRFGSVFPEGSTPYAVVVCLPGLSEFAEKYFETAGSVLKRNMAFWIIDWANQGRSSRPLDNPHKRHSSGFDDDIDDLQELIMNYIKPASVSTDKGRIPLAMLAHSMGANIGLNHMIKYPGMFECAALSTPMIGLKAVRFLPMPVTLLITTLLNIFAPTTYVHGEGDWRQESRPAPGNDAFSGDPVRGAVHNAWCLADPELQVGRVTYGWLHEAMKSCAKLQNKRLLKTIQAHCLIALAGHEDFVDNSKIRKIARILPHTKLLEFPDARHEILMERDETRKLFFEAFQQLVKESIIDRPETLKPF